MHAMNVAARLVATLSIMQITLCSLPQTGPCQGTMAVEVSLNVGPFMSIVMDPPSLDLGIVSPTDVPPYSHFGWSEAIIKTNQRCEMQVRDSLVLHLDPSTPLSPALWVGVSINPLQVVPGRGPVVYDPVAHLYRMEFLPGYYGPNTDSNVMVGVTKQWDITDTPGTYTGILEVILVPKI